jgi:hypothetical protein
MDKTDNVGVLGGFALESSLSRKESGGLFEGHNEPSDSIKCCEFLE